MILVTGVSGQLGHAFRTRLGDGAVYLDRDGLDLTQTSRIRQVVEDHSPTVVINCAAYTAVDRAETDRDTARSVNATAVGALAEVCADIGAKLITYSTDYVFDGSKVGGYVESDAAAPINVYGTTKRDGEVLALAADPTALVIRTSWVMSGTHRSFASVMRDLVRKGEVTVVDDQIGRPTFVDDLVTGTLGALDGDASGILHLTNTGSATWYDIAREIALLEGLDPGRVRPCTTADFPTAARRPANSVLDSQRTGPLGLHPLRGWQPALAEALAQLDGGAGLSSAH
jgi:dTDP-4-dehydrorhamnose reductase